MAILDKFNRKRWRAYLEVFNPDGLHSREVLKDLCAAHNVFNPAFDPDPIELARMAGLNLIEKRPGSLLENSANVALSLIPNATAEIACGANMSWNGYSSRIAGFGTGLAVIPFALIERFMGRSGIMIYLAQKVGGVDPGPSE